MIITGLYIHYILQLVSIDSSQSEPLHYLPIDYEAFCSFWHFMALSAHHEMINKTDLVGEVVSLLESSVLCNFLHPGIFLSLPR